VSRVSLVEWLMIGAFVATFTIGSFVALGSSLSN
jgi:hypothetical protein